MLRLGIIPPIVNRNPRFSPPEWELNAEVDDLATVIQAAERLGYEFACFPQHVAIPEEGEERRGKIYWDPAPTMGYIAARTSSIRLATYVIVLGYYHPLQIAKTYGTLDRISGGRLILGLGVGSLEPEFKLLDRPFGVYHVAGDGDCTWAELAAAIFEEAGIACRVRPITTEELGRPAPRPAYSVLRSEKDAPVLPHWREGLRACLDRLG